MLVSDIKNTANIPIWGTSAADIKRNIHLTASSSVTTRQCSSKLVIALAVPSLDGDPDSFTFFFGLYDLLFQAVEPDATIEHFAHLSVFTNEDAAFGIRGGVASMDADALEFGHAEQDGKPLLELGRE